MCQSLSYHSSRSHPVGKFDPEQPPKQWTTGSRAIGSPQTRMAQKATSPLKTKNLPHLAQFVQVRPRPMQFGPTEFQMKQESRKNHTLPRAKKHTARARPGRRASPPTQRTESTTKGNLKSIALKGTYSQPYTSPTDKRMGPTSTNDSEVTYAQPRPPSADKRIPPHPWIYKTRQSGRQFRLKFRKHRRNSRTRN